MVEITLSIPNPTDARRAVDALCVAGGYMGDPDDQPAKREFARRMLRDYVHTTVQRVEQAKATAAAVAAVVVKPINID